MWKKRSPSQILLGCVNGIGRGDEIDDYVHSKLNERELNNVVGPLMVISSKFSTKSFPIGISNPDPFPSIVALAKSIELDGM